VTLNLFYAEPDPDRWLPYDRYPRAMIKALWLLAHGIAYTYLDEACEVAEWIYQLDQEFKLPEQGMLQ